MMSYPNHPTSDIEDAFSSNFPDYIPASPDYFPASPGNTFSESSNNLSSLVPIASPTLLLFHNDPYIKVMQSYDAIICHKLLFYPQLLGGGGGLLSLMLSLPMFDDPKISCPPEKKDIQVRHQADKESLLNAIYEHKNSQEGPSDY
ncbi:hypothetical protein Tco_1024305 [Tanacetum coccineum]